MQDKLSDWLQKQGFVGEDSSVHHVRTGENNSVFEVLDNENEFVLKLNRKGGEVEKRLSKEADVLRFLEDHNLQTAQLTFFDSDTELGSVLIQEYIGERDIDYGELSGEQIKSLTSTLSSLHSISIDKYNSFFNKDAKSEFSASEYFMDHVDTVEAFWKSYTELTEPEAEIKDLFKKGLEILKNIESDQTLKKSFCHMDFINNMRATDDEIYLVDWELARPEMPEYSLITQFRRARIGENDRKMLLQAYREESNRKDSYNELERELWTAFLMQDFTWILQRLEKEKEAGNNIERYEDKLRDRKKRLKHYIDNGELLMEKMYHGR
jgi:thiamine kinase-like enzyme